ncbi:putative bifunctional diguanylate cyclase/phosphodiesterase [Roseibium sp.]|uniref:putative bifunctional diguanylate cyclase/phosphodiesterase n=1 Tax=Roseibium sp. TaxID=1936156 RepID=UPI003A97DBCC
MISVISCIVFEHDFAFVLMAALVCVCGCLLTTNLYVRLRSSVGARQYLWLFLAGLVGGATVWTTHFVAMLGYVVPFDRTFEPMLTLVSLTTAIVTASFGFWITSLMNNRFFIGFGGMVIGMGIAVMHYLGMAAYQIPALLDWDETYVVASVFLAAAFAAAATLTGAEVEGRKGVVLSSLLMVLGIVGLHFTGMTGLTVLPFRGLDVPLQTISDQFMLFSVVGVTGIVLASVAAAFLIESQGMEEASLTYKHLALHDPLTGVPNRFHLRERLNEELRQLTGRSSGGLGVIAINLNRFKDINDLHGHAVGDMVLREVAKRLSGVLGPGEYVARIGGDEFVAIKVGVRSADELEPFGERLKVEVNRPILWDHNRISLTCSLGAALAPHHGREVEELLVRANLAVEACGKQAGEDFIIFSSKMEEESRHRAAIAIDLRSAAQNGQLELHYQPQNETATRGLQGFEALVRWRHPEHGLISPVEFIPVAEETGLILEIGRWVLNTACMTAAKWPDRFSVAVNVSAFQLAQDTLPLQVASALAKSGLAPSRLEIEITESGVITDQAHALEIVMALKELGVSVAMDDFGTGYSSLSTLQSFPFDKIKIDREFVKSLGDSQQSSAIIRSTILLGASLGIPVLAEGVETEEQLAILKMEGCKAVQGYLFGRPQPEAEAERLIDLDDQRLQGNQVTSSRVVPIRA